MIVVDTSVLISIFTDEDDAALFAAAIGRAPLAMIGSPTAMEFLLVCRRKLGVAALDDANAFLARADFQIIPWTPHFLQEATHALRRFSGAPANLNFGDCLTYAVAKSLDLPLLYKGKDFNHTDLKSALA